MQTITTPLRQMPQARAMRERSTTAALVAFYGAVALIAAITLGMPFTHPF
ncbi:hypothetical protein [Bradyrhizobium sp. STM 3809]|nr:hypothetical protein [Bradyrhizobium sp. STM 3809]CCE02798.1 exported hypothetical protein [Bradyrhizobium sp. STM 3809]